MVILLEPSIREFSQDIEAFCAFPFAALRPCIEFFAINHGVKFVGLECKLIELRNVGKAESPRSDLPRESDVNQFRYY
jgi:hypothetical protein